jgi:hypothetical protein
MDLTNLSKPELLAKCEELGITKCKSKNKNELIELLNKNLQPEKKPTLIIEDDDDIIVDTVITPEKQIINPQLIEILTAIEWQKFHNLCVNIGKELNDRQFRFLKAVFLENAVAEYSNNVLTYVGDTQEGCDLIAPSIDNLKIEMKYVEGCLFTGKKLTLNKTTKEIKLINSNGTNKHSELPQHYSDYLLIVDLNGAAIISKDTLKKYVSVKGDSLTAKIPTNELHIIFQPSDITQLSEKIDLNIKQKVMNLVKEIINGK